MPGLDSGVQDYVEVRAPALAIGLELAGQVASRHASHIRVEVLVALEVDLSYQGLVAVAARDEVNVVPREFA
jgi:hypothetical protein